MVIIYIAIVLRHETDRRVLSDEGHTCSISPTKIDERDLHKGTRQKVITSALDASTLEDRQGELVMPIHDERYGDALFSFVRDLIKIADVTNLSRERVKSTFLEDFRDLLIRRIFKASGSSNKDTMANLSLWMFIPEERLDRHANASQIVARSLHSGNVRDSTKDFEEIFNLITDKGSKLIWRSP
jgi:Domain of unknown function DUF1828